MTSTSEYRFLSALFVGIAAVAAAGSGALAQQQKPEPDKRALVNELFKEMDVRGSLATVIEQLATGDRFHAYGLKGVVLKRVRSTWRKAIASSFRPRAFLSDLEATYAKSANIQDIVSELDFQRSALGRKVRALESRVDPLTQEETRQAGMELRQRADRRMLVAEIAALAGFSETSANISIVTDIGCIVALHRAQLGELASAPLPKLIRRVETPRDYLVKQNEASAVLLAAVLYKSLTVDQLVELRDHLASLHGLRHTQGMLKASTAAYRAQMMAVGERFGILWGSDKS